MQPLGLTSQSCLVGAALYHDPRSRPLYNSHVNYKQGVHGLGGS